MENKVVIKTTDMYYILSLKGSVYNGLNQSTEKRVQN